MWLVLKSKLLDNSSFNYSLIYFINCKKKNGIEKKNWSQYLSIYLFFEQNLKVIIHDRWQFEIWYRVQQEKWKMTHIIYFHGAQKMMWQGVVFSFIFFFIDISRVTNITSILSRQWELKESIVNICVLSFSSYLQFHVLKLDMSTLP